MKVLFKNITKYDEDMYTEFLKFHQIAFGTKYSIYTAFIIGLLLILLVMQIKLHNMDFAILICFIITGFFIWRYLRPATEVTQEFNSKKIQEQKEFTFMFFEKNLKICEGNKLQRYVIRYNQLYKVFETKNFFYLYVDKNHALLINKNAFIIGDSISFSDFMKNKCKFKYKNKLKNYKFKI